MVDENEFFRQATLRISSSLKSETALQRCMTYLQQHMPVSGIFFRAIRPQAKCGTVTVCHMATQYLQPE